MREQADELPVTSSVPLQFPGDQKAVFRDVLTVFEETGLPFVVSGAFALQQHTGIFRCTKDLDIFLCPEDTPAALWHLQNRGFVCEVRDPVWLANAHRDGYFVDLITGMSNGATVQGEAPEMFPFMGTSRLAEVIDRHGADLVVHGHAHHGTLRGKTTAGVPVHNVAISLLQAQQPSAAYRVFEI